MAETNFKSIPQMIRDRANTYSSREVFRFIDKKTDEQKSMSWNQFVDGSAKVSKALLSKGFGLESKIGIFSNNRPEWTISDIGILDIRAIVVPFFATASKEQCKYIVDETEMKLMFVGDEEQLEKAVWLLDNTHSLEQVVVFEKGIELTDNRCVDFSHFCDTEVNTEIEAKHISLQSEAKLSDLATILYTSGTTGEPKGVMLNNENFLHTFKVHVDRLDLSDKDVSMAFLPLSHIFERTWSFYLLYVGGTNFYNENPRQIIDVLPIAKPTAMCTVPRFYEKTYEGIIKETNNWSSTKKKIFNWSIKIGSKVSNYRKKGKALPAVLKMQYGIADKLVLSKLRAIFGGNMRTMPCSGAALPIHLLKFFHATGVFVNYGYGATETTATVSCFKTDEYEFESCGTLMPEMEVKISTENEILVKGKSVFVGYYKKPEETKEVLKDGWYCTGDEGQITADGNLLMTDRLKDLMKTSVGKYISPQKLETLLGQDTMIEQVVVVGDNKKYVTALIVPVVEQLQALAESLELKFADVKELLSHVQIRDHMLERINQLQNELTNYEKIKDFVLLTEPFSIEANTLTSTLKTKRKVILKLYKKQIDAMYA